jgi:hypothetical protein
VKGGLVMALKDYAAIDEDDFYGQPFEEEGFVSIWVGMTDDSEDPEDLDVLQDLCGVGYYNLDLQESNSFDFKPTDLRTLLSEMSFSDSFIDTAIKAASQKGIDIARWIILQYDFKYDPAQVKRKAADDPIFLGAFEYKEY